MALLTVAIASSALLTLNLVISKTYIPSFTMLHEKSLGDK